MMIREIAKAHSISASNHSNVSEVTAALLGRIGQALLRRRSSKILVAGIDAGFAIGAAHQSL